jgi:hypothetical protein
MIVVFQRNRRVTLMEQGIGLFFGQVVAGTNSCPCHFGMSVAEREA